MEIVEKVKLRIRENEEEVEARIDTGAEITMFDEKVLLKIGAFRAGNKLVDFGGEKKKSMPAYHLLDMQIRDCVINFPEVIGGNKNLVGHDILQKVKAVIDEGKGTIEFPVDDGTIEI